MILIMLYWMIWALPLFTEANILDSILFLFFFMPLASSKYVSEAFSLVKCERYGTACVSMSLASPLLYFQVLWACPSPSHLDSWRKPPVSGSSLSEAPSIVSVGLPATSYCRLLRWPLCRTLTVSRRACGRASEARVSSFSSSMTFWTRSLH